MTDSPEILLPMEGDYIGKDSNPDVPGSFAEGLHPGGECLVCLHLGNLFWRDTAVFDGHALVMEAIARWFAEEALVRVPVEPSRIIDDRKARLLAIRRRAPLLRSRRWGWPWFVCWYVVTGSRPRSRMPRLPSMISATTSQERQAGNAVISQR